jgi:hypothetical protein
MIAPGLGFCSIFFSARGRQRMYIGRVLARLYGWRQRRDTWGHSGQRATLSDRWADHPPSGLGCQPAHPVRLRIDQDYRRAAQGLAPRPAQDRLAVQSRYARLQSNPPAEADGQYPSGEAFDYPHVGRVATSIPSSISARRDSPRHRTAMPGGGSRERPR